LSEQIGGNFDARRLSMFHAAGQISSRQKRGLVGDAIPANSRVHLEVILNNIRNSLCICRRTTPADEYPLVHRRQLVRDPAEGATRLSRPCPGQRTRQTDLFAMYDPVVVRESAPTTTPPLNCTDMMVVCSPRGGKVRRRVFYVSSGDKTAPLDPLHPS
jgi:hypothetical protein